MVEWDGEVISRPVYTPKWDISASESAEIPAEWKLFFRSAVNLTMPKALIGAAPAFVGPSFLLPTRNGEVFRWCLAHGLRVVQLMTLMSLGLYNEPQGAFLPSILY